ncbi:MAG TPA: hypothetical protein VJ501_08485 [Burkholderiaceae bacterium]|nr:hypothetical protein [Burkholderiaceae bacterium]
MTMKRTEIEKRNGLKIANEMRLAGHRYDVAAPVADRRAQRERERAAGLVPFAIKLHGDLVRQLNARANQRQVPLNELVDQLLRSGLNTEKEAR